MSDIVSKWKRTPIKSQEEIESQEAIQLIKEGWIPIDIIRKSIYPDNHIEEYLLMRRTMKDKENE